LRRLGLEQYEATFHANGVDAEVLRDLTDQDLRKLGVVLGDRHKLLRAIATMDGAFAPVSAPRPTPSPISPETILAAAAAGALPERQQGEDYSVSPPPQPSPMSARRRPAEMISDRSLLSPERTTSWLTASDDRDGDDIQGAETGEAHGDHNYYDDLPSKHWRDRLVMVIAVIALAGLGAGGAFAYRAVFAEAVLSAPPPIIKAENAPNENVPNSSDNRPSDLSQTSVASAGSSEEFVSRFPADNQEPPTAPMSPNPSASQPTPGSAIAPMATTPFAPPPSIAPLAPSLPPKVAAPVSVPSSPTPKKTKTVISRSDGSGRNDTSAATAKSPAANRSAAAAAPQAGNQLAPDVAAHHLKQSRPPRRRFRSEGLCRSLLTRMAIRRRRRFAPVCPRVRQPLQRLPPAGVTRLRWPPNAARLMPTRSFEVSRPNSPTSSAGVNRSCAAPILVPRASITRPRLAPSCQRRRRREYAAR
jgi:hypothetical protein